MPGPFFAQHLATEAVLVVVSAEAVVVFGIRTVLGDLVESVGGGAQTDDRSGPIQIVHEMFHLVGRPVLKASENYHEVGRDQFLDARDIVGTRLDYAVGVDPEHYGAFEAMVFGQDAGEGRQSLLGTIFVVARDKDEMLAFAEAFFSIVNERGSGKSAH